MATQNLTTSTPNPIYIHENRSDYNKHQSLAPADLIDGIFTIPDSIDTLTLQDKLTERLTQLYAATNPPEDPDTQINSDYLWMLQAMIAEVRGIVDELNNRWVSVETSH